MNRAERRRLQRSDRDGVINIKQSDIQKIKQDATDKAVRQAFTMMMHVPLIVLRDKYGFGAKRLDAFMNYMLDSFDSIERQYVNFEDLKQALEEETGIRVEA